LSSIEEAGGDEPVLVDVELSAGPSVVLELPDALGAGLVVNEPLLLLPAPGSMVLELVLPLGAGSFFWVFFIPSAQAGAASSAKAVVAESKVVRMVITPSLSTIGGENGPPGERFHERCVTTAR